MKEIYVHLRELAGTLQVGETRRLRCPFCEGGRTGESSFSLSRTSDAECLYHCFRATCSKAGRLACPGFRLAPKDSGNQTGNKPRSSIKVYSGRTVELGEGWIRRLADRYEISKEEATWAQWSEAAEDGSLVCRIFGPSAVQTAVLLRSVGPVFDGTRTHSILYPETDGVRQAWFRRPGVPQFPVVVVEDVISALKVSRQFTAVALLGTTLNESKLEEILSVSKCIVLALDNDATELAFRYQKVFALWGIIKVAVLERDLKYESDERIKSIITNAR